MLAPLKTRWMPENESGLLKTQPSSHWARCGIFVRTNEHRLSYMACGHWSGKYVLSILIGKADQKCLHSLVMDNGNINGLAPKLDSLTLYNIVQRDRYHVMWSFYRISHGSCKDIHFRGWENPTKSQGPPTLVVFRGPMVKGHCWNVFPKERSSYFIFHLPQLRRHQNAWQASLHSHLELLLHPW